MGGESWCSSGIVGKVRDRCTPPFRPDFKGLGWESMQRLVAWCLEEQPAARPTVTEVLSQLKAENKCVLALLYA